MVKLKVFSEKEDITDSIKSAITAEIKRLEVGLNRTHKEIKIFEEKYKVTSEVFLKNFTAEDLKGGDDEYVKWAGELKIRDRILEELKKLNEIEYVDN
ncbi:MAG: hypothetical protein MRK02_15450 [Candidatus Scalindua sp.]|nr:hypothetical protein [Candidatus Scalindua sp.]